MGDETSTSDTGARPEHERVMTMVRWLLYLVFILIGYTMLGIIAPIIMPLLVAAGIAYLLDPLVDRLELKIPRAVAVALLLVTFLVLLSVALAAIIPLIVDEGAHFIAKLPAMVDNASASIAARFGLEVPASWQDYLKSEEVTGALKQFVGPATALLAAAVGGFFHLLAFLAETLLIPVFAFYFLVDWDHMIARGRKMIPPRHRASVVDTMSEIDSVVSGWLRGQFTVTAILAILYATCFKLIGIHLAITIGLLVGALTIIPFIGTIVGAAITTTILLLDYQGGTQLAWVGAVFLSLHVLEAGVLTPKIVGHRVGLSEVGALFAVLAGGQLLGFAGVLLAVPLAAAVAVLVRRAYKHYEDSEFFSADDAVAESQSEPARAD